MIVHINAAGGHRQSYQSLFLKLLDGEASTGVIRGPRFWRLVRAPKVLFATIDDDYLGFIAVALIRALLNKPTTGLFIRAMQCFRTERPIVYPLKRAVFRSLRRLSSLRILSIIPHDIRPELAEVTYDWIHDPQMWDLWVDGPPMLPDTDLSRRVQTERGTRKVIIFVGRANRNKGFPELVETARRESGGMLVVVAGCVARDFKREADILKVMGMIVEDRYVSDDEILSLYKVADQAWCRYAPEYDQASGVFGRAVQTGVEPIVNDGSVLQGILKAFIKSYTSISHAKTTNSRSKRHY